MKDFSLKHLSDERLRRELSAAATNEKHATAELVAHIAEFDARKLYLSAAYESMFAYCVGELRLSEPATKKRIWVARAALRCPIVLEALAEGRVHLSGLALLASHLTHETAPELLAAATHKTRDEIEVLLATRFPKRATEARVESNSPISQPLAAAEGSPGNLPELAKAVRAVAAVFPAQSPARITPLSAEAYAVQFTRSHDEDQEFRYLQDLLGHKVARGDIAGVYAQAVKELIKKVEKVRFGACTKPHAGRRRGNANPRYVPAGVRRTVWQRDGGQCTFVSQAGRRCEARGNVEFDHAKEFARGGEATVDNIRLRCRGHNQHTAERTFGAGFMQRKRDEAKAAVRRRATPAEPDEQLLPHELEVIPWLRELGCSAADSDRAAMRCREMADASLEARVKRALSYFGERCGRKVAPASATGASAAEPAGLHATG